MLYQCRYQILDLNIPRMSLVMHSYDFIFILHLSPTILFSFAHPLFILFTCPSPLVLAIALVSFNYLVSYSSMIFIFALLLLFPPTSLSAAFILALACVSPTISSTCSFGCFHFSILFFISLLLYCSLMVFYFYSFVLYNVLCVHLVNVSLENHVFVVFSPIWL